MFSCLAEGTSLFQELSLFRDSFGRTEANAAANGNKDTAAQLTMEYQQRKAAGLPSVLLCWEALG